MPPEIPNDIFKPSQSDEQKDELSIFSGKTHTVSTVSAVSPPVSRSASSSQGGSPSQIYADNPSFAGVHPSLLSELNSFQPFIREQVENAYRIGGDVFGGEPMVIDPIRYIPAGLISGVPTPAQPQPSSVQQMAKQLQLQQIEQEQQRKAVLQQQQQQQQQQLENERLERERQELERLELIRQELERQEMERQELERLELARRHAEQQELHRQQEFRLRELQRQQHAQQEAINRQDQQALRRQQERAEQLQKQEQYRQQLEIQQRQLEQTAQYPRFQSNSAANVAPATTTTRQKPSPNSAHTLRRQVSHSQSSSNLSQMYQQTQQGMDQITPQQTGSVPVPPNFSGTGVSQVKPATQPYFQASMSHTQITSQHITTTPRASQPQHSMYAIPRNEFPLPDSMGSTPAYSPQTTPFSQSPLPSSHISPIAETYKYWPAATSSFAMPVDLPSGVSISDFNPQTPLQPQPHYHHYTPEGALRGIAADDSSLQETWQSYMNKVWINVILQRVSCLINLNRLARLDNS